MRDVKFQVWDDEFKQMFSWEELLEFQPTIGSFFGNESIVRREYTGLSDKKEQELYDHDIVLLDDDTPMFGGYLTNTHYALIKYGGRNEEYIHAGYYLIFTDVSGREITKLLDWSIALTIEKVGNLYENSELLVTE